MHLILHICKKDVRRLWWAILATWLLLAALAQQDRWRADVIVGSAEGWLNLLLPLAWCCLIALAVHEEAPADDREFWLTRPYRWQTLLASKLLFAALFIHVPGLIADACILALRGFQPLAYLPELLEKQVMVAAVLTVPAMALAALFASIAQFMLAALVILGAAAYLSGVTQLYSPYLPPDWARYAVAGFVVSAAGFALLPLQYARRRTIPARAAGAAAAVLAGLLLAYLPANFTDRVNAMLHPAPGNIAIRISPSRHFPFPMQQFAPWTYAGIPLAVSGLAAPADFQTARVDVELVGPDGQRYDSAKPGLSPDQLSNSFWGYIERTPDYYLLLRLPSSVWGRLKNGKVRIKGTITLWFQRAGQTEWMPLLGTPRMVAGVGLCSGNIGPPFNMIEDAGLKILCESPAPFPARTALRIWQPQTGHSWTPGLTDGMYRQFGVKGSWLSPLNRRDSQIPIEDPATAARLARPDTMTRELLQNARMAITPYQTTGWAVVDFDFRDVKLGDYVKSPAH